MTDSIVVGIDLGTTFSAVAYVDEHGRAQVIPNAEGHNTTPSVVRVGAGPVVVGDAAVNQWVTDQEHVVRWIKRAIGDSDYRFQGLDAVQISAEILKVLKSGAECSMGQPIAEAVITCPAYFDSVEIENTKRAGELAGLNVREIVKEPTAAAVYYGIEHMRDGEKIMVCDLGGGTFDATVLAYENRVFVPRASTGDRELGGHEWTMELVELAADRIKANLGEDPRDDLVSAQMLYEACEQAKRDLRQVAEVAIPCRLQGRMEQVVVTRDEFEARTEWRMQIVVARSGQALDKARMTWADLDRILLVGGSSRLRRMAEALKEVSGKDVTQTREPDLMVALGAAILARGQVRPRRPSGGLVDAPRGGLVEVNYKRTITRSLGTRAFSNENNKPRITNALLIPHGTECPVERSRDDLEVSCDGQEYFDVPVVEFESDDDYEARDGYRFICPRDVRRGDGVRVTFSYDVSGIVTVQAVHLRTGQVLQLERTHYQEPSLDPGPSVRAKPRWVVFAVDTSYSMDGSKMSAARRAVTENACDLLRRGGGAWKVGIVSFATSAKVECRPTADMQEIEVAVKKIAPSGTTAMDDGIRLAVEQALQAPAGADRDIVMVTDGMPDSARRDNTVAAAQRAKTLGVNLSTLGLGKDDVDEEFLKRLTPLTLVIEGVEGMAQAMTTLLTQSSAKH
jgi:molecular chaperone DnaK